MSQYYQQLALSQITQSQDKGPTGQAAPIFGPDAYPYIQAQVGPNGSPGPQGETIEFLFNYQ